MKSIRITDPLSTSYFEITSANNEIGELEGWEYAEVKDSIEDVSGKQDSIYVTSKHGRRIFSLQGVKKMTLAERRSTLLKVIRQRGVKKVLTFTTLDNVALQAEIEVRKILWPYTSLKKPFLIELVAPDHRFYAQSPTVYNSNDASQTVVNAGNEDTEPVFRCYGAGTSFTIENTTTSESLTITYTLVAGDFIEVDCKNRTVKLNGITDVFSSLTAGDFFSLIPGDNVLAWSKVAGDGSTSLRTTLYDAYNGV